MGSGRRDPPGTDRNDEIKPRYGVGDRQIETQSHLRRCGKSDRSTQELSTPVETVSPPWLRSSSASPIRFAIAHYLRQYDTHARSALTVLARIRSGEDILTHCLLLHGRRVAQAEHDAAEAEQQRDDSERRASLSLGEKSHAHWPLHQVRASSPTPITHGSSLTRLCAGSRTAPLTPIRSPALASVAAVSPEGNGVRDFGTADTGPAAHGPDR